VASPSTSTAEQQARTLRARASESCARQSREQAEEELILRFLPLVRHIVHRVAGQVSYHHDIEDLISAGTLGLVKAARSFDPSRDAEFKTYAYIRVRGAVIDELRGRSFVPSAVHQKIRAIQAAYQQFAAERGRPPSDEELAAKMDMPLAQLYRAMEETRRQHFLSIYGLSDDSPAFGALVPQDGEPDPEHQAERREMLENMTEAIQGLPRKQRLVLLLYYERDLTMKETAKVLGLTESRVSQLHASALFSLSMKLGAGK